MICDSGGKILAHGFPPGNQPPSMARAAQALAEGVPGLETVTGTIGIIDLKYEDSRIVVKPVNGAHMVFLCTATMNLQPLAISASVAAPKIEKLLAAGAGARPAAPRAGGELFQLTQRIGAAIERKGLDVCKTRGAISLRAGFSLAFVDEDTPDDPQKLSQLRAAAESVLGRPI
jgi:hypothetical protein